MRNVIDFLYNIDNSRSPVRVKFFDISVRNRENLDVRCGVTVVRMITHRTEMAREELVSSEAGSIIITEKLDLG